MLVKGKKGKFEHSSTKEVENFLSEVQCPQQNPVLEPGLQLLGKPHVPAQQRLIQHLSSVPHCSDPGAALAACVVVQTQLG